MPEVAVSRFFSGGGFSDYVRDEIVCRSASDLIVVVRSSHAQLIRKRLLVNTLLLSLREPTKAFSTRALFFVFALQPATNR